MTMGFHRNPRAEGPTWLNDEDYAKAVEQNRLEARYSGIVGPMGHRSITRALQEAPRTREGATEITEAFAREFAYAAAHDGAELPEMTPAEEQVAEFVLEADGYDHGGEAA
jgi:hypothetical protein